MDIREIPMASLLEYIQPYLNLIIALIVVAIVYFIAKKLLYKLRLRGLITHGTEGTLRAIILIAMMVIALPIAFSSIFQRYEIAWLSIATLIFIGIVVVVSLYSYIENSLMYLIVISSGIVREGDNVEIVVDGKSYTGRVILAEGSHMMLRTNHNASILIPYRKVFNAIIVKKQHILLKFMAKIYGYNIDVKTLIERIVNVLKRSKTIIREEISVKPHEISDNSVTLAIELGIMNPSSINECYEEIVKNLTSELPYRVDIEVID